MHVCDADRKLLGLEGFDLETRALKLKGCHFRCVVRKGYFRVSCFIDQTDLAINICFDITLVVRAQRVWADVSSSAQIDTGGRRFPKIFERCRLTSLEDGEHNEESSTYGWAGIRAIFAQARSEVRGAEDVCPGIGSDI